MRHRPATLIFSMLALLLASLTAPTVASAGSYWWTGTPAAGSNGFSWQQTGGWNPWGGSSRCENSATTYGTGSYCQLVWNVPANLDPVSGSIQGSYRQANANFEQQMFVEGNGTTVIQGDTNTRAYNRQWPDMASYLYIRVINTGAPASTSAGTVWFDASSMSINLVDPYSPGLNILEGHGGWKGTSGACIRYGYGEAGSGLDATSLVNVNTGAVYDNPGYQTSAITTGVFQNDRNCVGVPAPGTGTYTLRAAAVDKSGNYVSNDFNVSFDTTAPALSDISSGGTAVTNGRVFTGSAGGYRPAFAVTVSDAHSGLASVQAFLDGNLVANAGSYTPPSNLALGSHTIMFRATDAVGNQSQVSRSFVVADDVRPTVTIAEPAANGSNEPILDISATDDHSGVNASTWTVSVNGVQMPASGTTRLQMGLGRLANGTHTLVIRIRDNAGNERVTTIEHVANQDTYTPPSPTGLFAITGPLVVYEGGSFHLIALAVKDGRPLAGQRFELLPPGSSTAIAGKNATADGSVDMLVEGAVEGPLLLTMPGSGLAPIPIEYTFHKKASAPYCVEFPSDASCQSPAGGGDGSGGTTGTTGGSSTTGGDATGTTGGTTNGVTGGTGTGTTTNVGTSGTAADKVAPKVTVRIAVKTKPGVVRRTRQILLRINTNERSNYTVLPVGNQRATRVFMTKPLAQTKVVRIKLTGKLLLRIQRAKTKYVIVTVRVVGIDANKNIVRKTIRLRVLR
jgi:hypothetical protein